MIFSLTAYVVSEVNRRRESRTGRRKHLMGELRKFFHLSVDNQLSACYL